MDRHTDGLHSGTVEHQLRRLNDKREQFMIMSLDIVLFRLTVYSLIPHFVSSAAFRFFPINFLTPTQFMVKLRSALERANIPFMSTAACVVFIQCCFYTILCFRHLCHYVTTVLFC